MGMRAACHGERSGMALAVDLFGALFVDSVMSGRLSVGVDLR